jgi:hypothetical protein
VRRGRKAADLLKEMAELPKDSSRGKLGFFYVDIEFTPGKEDLW